MKFITQGQLISYFDSTTYLQNKHLFDDFLKKAQVKTSNKLVPLLEYAKAKSIPNSDLKILFENIVERNAYLERFFDTSLKFDTKQLAIKEDPMLKSAMNNNTRVEYKNIIRSMHFLDILRNTTSGLENIPSYLNVLSDLYNHWIIDYKIVTPSSRHYIREGRIGSVFSSLYFRASIMNPYLVYSLNESVLKGVRVFTPTLGWTSYCYGFMESPNIVEYVGTDVIPAVCKKTSDFANTFYPSKKCTIFCEPSENLMKQPGFLRKYREHFDVVFFSPPYYELELYPGKKQSTTVYKTYEEWLEGYWRGTMILCNQVLKRGGKMCYILSSYGKNASLLRDMNKIAKEYFELVKTMSMQNKNVNVTMHRETDEKIMIFVKG